MVDTGDVKSGRGGDLAKGFGFCADGSTHPADEANAALPGGADPREITRYMREMNERIADAAKKSGVEHRDYEVV